MGLRLISGPTTATLSLEAAKAHLRVVDSDDDEIIQTLVKAATLNAENWMGRALVDQTWELVLDGFPPVTSTYSSVVGQVSNDTAIMIPKPPLIAVTQVAYDDSAGDEQIMNANDYYVDNASEPGWVALSGITSWPTTIDAINSVRIRFRAGYVNNDSPADTSVPDDILSGIKLILGSLYEHREQQVVGVAVNKLPFGVESLLRHYRVLLGMA